MFQCDCPPKDCAGCVRAFLHGNRGAGDALARKFTPLVQAVVARVLGPSRRGEWEDACQTIFLRLFSNLHRWEGKCPFCKWLAVVAARRAIDLSRLGDPVECRPLEQVPDHREEPPDRETIDRIATIVAKFPPQWREIWEGWLAGERREDLARRVGKSLRTVQYWLAEMLDTVRESLDA